MVEPAEKNAVWGSDFVPDELKYLVERLFADCGHLGLIGGETYGDENEGTLVSGAVEHLAEEAHGAGSVGESGEAG